MNLLEVRNLSKKYPTFALKNVSFALEEGKIIGFIGRNGAGKTTTLNCLLNFVHPDAGDILFFGMNFKEHELEIKPKIGFVSGGIRYYPHKKLNQIARVTKGFYQTWDETVYQEYMSLFGLDENKTPSELSDGTKVKFSLALAMSHGAKLLLLDEPTSGLDPVSRDELLDIFIELASRGVTILFSTHITSDLDKCADHIVYIRSGEIVASSSISDFRKEYSRKLWEAGQTENDNLENIMLFIEREGRKR